MRHLVFQTRGQVAWQETETPVLSDRGGALLRPLAVARCDLDVAMVRAGLFPGPFPVGHEVVAEVIEVGEAGLYAVALSVALGAGGVSYVDRDPQRCGQAERLGANVIHHQGAWPRRFSRAPITVENTGEPDGLICTLRSTEDYGTCTPVAIHFSPATPLPLLELYTRGITLHISRADSRRHLEAVLGLLTAGRFDPLAIQTTVVDWEEAADAWLEPATKLVIGR